MSGKKLLRTIQGLVDAGWTVYFDRPLADSPFNGGLTIFVGQPREHDWGRFVHAQLPPDQITVNKVLEAVEQISIGLNDEDSEEVPSMKEWSGFDGED